MSNFVQQVAEGPPNSSEYIAHHLTFLGFAQLPPDVRKKFQQQFLDSDAMRDLGAWHAFEQKNPLTFGNMYFFWVQKPDAS